MELNRCEFGDVIEGLQRWRDAGVRAQTCITSPPYWGLRDYGTGTWEGGNDPTCDHRVRRDPKVESSTLSGGKGTTGHQQEGYRGRCRRCGAERVDQQLGLEDTPEDYVARLVDVFNLVAEVLTEDGTLWLNLGDSYAGQPGGGQGTTGARASRTHTAQIPRGKDGPGLKRKDLVGIPWMVAFALRAAGWYLRSEIVWHKPNPMPESVRDRPARAHEQLFLLSRSRSYYYDGQAIAEPLSPASLARVSQATFDQQTGGPKDYGAGQNRNRSARRSLENLAKAAEEGVATRAKRSVWTVPLVPYHGAHFAAFPPKLVEPCILAGSRAGDVVLDPFMGTGTTAMVAERLGRRWIGCELDERCRDLQAERLRGTMGLEL